MKEIVCDLQTRCSNSLHLYAPGCRCNISGLYFKCAKMKKLAMSSSWLTIATGIRKNCAIWTV